MLNDFTWPRFGSGSSARAEMLVGIGMTPLLTSGTTMSGMPSASRLAYENAFGDVSDRLIDEG